MPLCAGEARLNDAITLMIGRGMGVAAYLSARVGVLWLDCFAIFISGVSNRCSPLVELLAYTRINIKELVSIILCQAT